MSINIPKDVVTAAESITAKIALDKLGPRQLTSLQKMLHCGVVYGNSLPARIALMMLKTRLLPAVHCTNWNIHWHHVPKGHEVYDRLTAVLVSRKMDVSSDRDYYRKQIAEDEKAISDQVPSGYSLTSSHTRNIMKTLNFSSGVEIHKGDVIEVDLLAGRL